MYQWLQEALQNESTVVSANRRLARVLREAFTSQQLIANRTAWENPAIHSWQDWLEDTLHTATDQASLPTRINAHQSQLLWERCLGQELGESSSNLASLVRLSRDAWQRMTDWRVPVRDVARAAQSHDQRLFASAAGRYLGILERQHWVDDAGLGALALALIEGGRKKFRGRISFVGFGRERPLHTAIMASLANAGCGVLRPPPGKMADRVRLQSFDNPDAEMRAAGAWARQRIEEAPGSVVAIVAGNLDQDAERKTRLVREGLVPGWQYAPLNVAQCVNVSYGRKLIVYPAVAIALLLMRWLVRDLCAGEIGHLLRTPMLSGSEDGGRSRLELKLRRLPDRRWSPAMISAAMRGHNAGAGASVWLNMVASLGKARRELKRKASPAEWAVFIDTILAECGWPGSDTLSSQDLQLVNRWRDLLNDLARLALVSPEMNLGTAVRRLELMATEIVFQPESVGGAVQLIGPLEASGAEFDAIWVSGLTAADWPPSGNPSPLLSRRLQISAGMPDADPADTVAYAESLLLSLSSSAPEVVCSYARNDDDAEQAPSALLKTLPVVLDAAQPDPGWHAARLLHNARPRVVHDTVPRVAHDEHIAGGAGTIQRQLNNPLGAFIAGRLGVRSLQRQAVGLPAALRGNIIHDALFQLYRGTPTRQEILEWQEQQLNARIEEAVDFAVSRHERHSDQVLIELLRLERQRVAELIERFVAIDTKRDDFSVLYVEQELAFDESGVKLQLRADRVDKSPNGSLAILDYKTGSKKTFLNSDGSPREIQMVAYALALDAPISSLALVNIDSREMGFSGAGQNYTDEADWAATLAGWKHLVRAACEDLCRGDVRINTMQSIREARDFNLLSRFTELLRGE